MLAPFPSLVPAAPPGKVNREPRYGYLHPMPRISHLIVQGNDFQGIILDNDRTVRFLHALGGDSTRRVSIWARSPGTNKGKSRTRREKQRFRRQITTASSSSIRAQQTRPIFFVARSVATKIIIPSTRAIARGRTVRFSRPARLTDSCAPAGNYMQRKSGARPAVLRLMNATITSLDSVFAARNICAATMRSMVSRPVICDLGRRPGTHDAFVSGEIVADDPTWPPAPRVSSAGQRSALCRQCCPTWSTKNWRPLRLPMGLTGRRFAKESSDGPDFSVLQMVDGKILGPM